MCGIAGIINFNGGVIERQDLTEMATYLNKRGPEYRGIWQDGSVGFVHTRLSIIDLTNHALQPMTDTDNVAVITFNGEIYNFKLLREELISLGALFNSKSDTEVILNGYKIWGLEKLISKLNGMFAFVIYDKCYKSLSMVRDRFGKKPLYYYFDNDSLLFSSDIRSIWKLKKSSLSINYDALNYYLSELSVPQPNTIWSEIKQVSPASFIQLNLDAPRKIKEVKYWDVSFSGNPSEFEDIDDVCERLEAHLVNSVTSRTVGDVPVCSMLSGGIDSGLIVGILASNSTSRVKTFTVGFNDDKFDETKDARKTAERYNTDHTEVFVDANILTVINDIVFEFGEPFADSSNIPNYFICREIARNYKVALTGDGGDEILGGYHEYLTSYYSDEFLKNYPDKTFRKIAEIYNRSLYKIGLANINFGMLNDFIESPSYMKLYRQMGFRPDEKVNLFSDEFKQHHSTHFDTLWMSQVWESSKEDSITDTLFKASFKTRLLNDYLVKTDRASMMNSLELRSPYLDFELVEFCASIPNKYKFHEGKGKFLLKRIAQKYLPDDILKRKKSGFDIPIDTWLRQKSLQIWVNDIIMSERFINRKIFNQKYVLQLWRAHLNGKNYGYKIWSLVCLELWFRHFND